MKKIKLEDFFSSENYSEVVISQEETKKLSNNLKYFCQNNQSIFRTAQKKIYNYEYNEILTNRAILPITYIFFERFIRSYKFYEIRDNDYETNNNFYKFENNENMEMFSERCSFSNKFNLSIILNFLKLLKNEKINKFVVINTKNDYVFKEKKFKNFLQHYYQFQKRFLIKINTVLEKINDKFNYYKKIPIVNASNATSAFTYNGFYLNYFSKLSNLKLINNRDFSKSLRNIFIKTLKEKNLNLDIFFVNLNLQDDTKKKIIDFYFDFLMNNYPMCFLENLKSNFDYQKKILEKFKVKKIFSSDDESSISTLSYFVSKNLSFEIIKFQHSGHYGYLNDTLEIDEIEVKNSDTFISNGWNGKIKKYDNKNYVNFVKLPSPLFSEKKKYFKSYKVSIDKKFDFVFLPQSVKPFTNPVQGAANFRRDVMKEYVNEFWELANSLHKNNLTANIKFYNRVSKNFIKKNLDKLQKKYENTFYFQNNFNKGLSIKLINSGNVILLDQPGTAFLECLNFNIPIMVYWKRSFCEPSKESTELFEQLKEVGIIHDEPETIIESYKEFKINHNEWLKNKKRRDVIKNFCERYGYADFNWQNLWKNFINKK